MKRAPLFFAFFVTCLAAAESTDGKASGIKAADLAALRSTKLHFVVPTRIPKGYKLTKVALAKNKEAMLVTLDLTYKKGNAQIVLQECSEGIGDIEFSDAPLPTGVKMGKVAFSLDLLKSKPEIEWQRAPHALMQWHMNWQSLPGKSYPRSISAIGDGSEPSAGIELIRSLRFLK